MTQKENAPAMTEAQNKTHDDSITMPRPHTRRAAVGAALQEGQKLTQADALRKGWGWRLAADICDLRHRHGWPIVTEEIQQENGGHPIARYWLPAGTRGTK